MAFIGIVYELVEAFTGGLHVHACQSHSIPRLIAERPFVDPPAVDGRQTIDDASTDCEFRVGGQFREMNRGYGKLADWVCDGSGTLLATACRTEVSNSDDTVHLNNQHSRGLTVGHAAHAVDFNRRPILSRQNVLALFRIPTASTNRAAELHEYQRSGFDDGEPFAVVQGYGKLLLRVEDVDSHGDAIAQRRAAGVPCDNLKSFCRMTVRNHRDVVERRHFVFSVVHQLQFDGV
ncbi:hypothetical protein [Bifidobacterium catenulatum]|uniref:hypothetical protein n=1 Tax=Bifidobacterium catenulatum TaxID=1686 RepID=UPI0034A33BD6